MKRQMKKLVRILILTASMCLMLTAAAFAATPAAPANLHQTDDYYDSVNVEWNADLNAKGYKIRYAESVAGLSGAEIEDCYSSAKDYKYNLSAGKSYYVQVRAYNSTSEGPWSAPVEVVTAPQQPEDQVIQTSATTSSITINYPAVPGATQYTVLTKNYDTNGTSWVESEPTEELSKKVTGLKSSGEYDVKVLAQRKSQTGYVTQGGNYRHLKDGKLAKTLSTKITGLKVDCSYAYIEKMSFKWSKKSNVDGYQIEMYNLKTKKTAKKTSNYYESNSYEVNPKTFYKVRVRSYVTMGNNKRKYSAWSKEIYAQLQQLPKLTQSGRKIKAKWSKVTGATGYTVYVAKGYNGSYKKCGTTTHNYYTITKCGSQKLKRGNTYYVKVVAKKKVGKKVYKGTSREGKDIFLR